MSVTTRSSGLERSFVVPREGVRVAGIAPGTYQIGVPRRVEMAPGQFRTTTAWVREITIDKDTIEEITLPE